MPRSNTALDYLRASIILLVLAHHSALAYVSFGSFDPEHYLASRAPIVDTERWAGFDLFVLFNDTFFMPLLFLLSGLFVWPSLKRHGAAAFTKRRLVRLGVPFLLGVTFLMPLAYYPSFQMTGSDMGFFAFWRMSVFSGPWPAGPLWFIWLLLAFDILAAGLFILLPQRGGLTSLMAPAFTCRPLAVCAMLAGLSAALYLPALRVFGPDYWLSSGPFAMQASRPLFYAAYFSVGVLLGAYGQDEGLLAHTGRLARFWKVWCAAAIVAFIPVIAVQGQVRAMVRAGPLIAAGEFAAAVAISAAASSFASLAIFLRFYNRRVALFESLSANSYGIYLIHYVFIVWLQVALLNAPLPAIVKAAAVFLGTLLLSWGAAAALRQAAAVRSVI
jgi:fucose 4-O-acetylase-like acetyltransferase